MVSTLLHNIASAEKFLLSSTKFWSLLSAAAISTSLVSFHSTQQYMNNFNNSGKYIFFVIISLHAILYFSSHKNLKNTFSPFFLDSPKKWALRVTTMRVAYILHNVPEQSLVGLVFVICVWIDVVAIARILKSSVDLWIINSVFMAVVSRSNALFGFTGRYWLIMLFCFPLLYIQIRLEGYKNEESKEKEQ